VIAVNESKEEKLKKKNEQKRVRESDTLKKKLTKQIQKSQPFEKAKPKEFIAKQKNPVKPEKLDGDKAMKPQEKPKPVDKKLKEGSALRRKLLKAKPGKRQVSEKEKALSKSVTDDKKARLSNHLQEKAKSRESLDKQRQSLQAEVKALSKLETVKESSGTEYTAKFSGFQSAIAAGPMGAASTGLRKLNPSILIDMKRAEAGAKVQNKIDPQIALRMASLGKIARDLKIGNLKEVKAPKVEKTVSVAKEANSEMTKIVNSKLRMKIQEVKDRLKEPNRNPSKFDELNMPFRGVGGVGGI